MGAMGTHVTAQARPPHPGPQWLPREVNGPVWRPGRTPRGSGTAGGDGSVNASRSVLDRFEGVWPALARAFVTMYWATRQTGQVTCESQRRVGTCKRP